MEKISSEELIAAVESCSEIVKTEIDRVTADSRQAGQRGLVCCPSGAKGLTVMDFVGQALDKGAERLWWKTGARRTGRPAGGGAGYA